MRPLVMTLVALFASATSSAAPVGPPVPKPAGADGAASALPQIKRLSLHIPAGATETHATGANDHGQVIGWYTDRKHNKHSFLWQKKVYTSITDLDHAPDVRAQAINNRGEVVGLFWRQGDYFTQSFLWRHGVWTALEHPDASHWGTVARGINDLGEIVGSAVFQAGPPTHTPPTPHGFLWEHGTWRTSDSPDIGTGGTELYGISNQGQIVGSSGDEWADGKLKPRIGFLWDHGILTRLHGPAGATGCRPSLIGGRGLIWGTYTDATDQTEYFLQDHGVYHQGTDLDRRLQQPQGHDHIDTLLTGGGTIVEVLWDK